MQSQRKVRMNSSLELMREKCYCSLFYKRKGEKELDTEAHPGGKIFEFDITNLQRVHCEQLLLK